MNLPKLVLHFLLSDRVSHPLSERGGRRPGCVAPSVLRSPFSVLRSIKVALVENDGCRNVVGLCRSQQTIDEARRRARETKCRHNTQKVYVGCNYVGLLAQFGRAANDTVAAVGNFGNHPRAVLKQLKLDAVSDSYRVGLFAAADAEIAPQTAGESITAVGQHIVPAASRAHHESIGSRFIFHFISLTPRRSVYCLHFNTTRKKKVVPERRSGTTGALTP